MKYRRMDSPGLTCLKQALAEILRGIEVRRFLEVGCGEGDISERFLKHGATGVGLDYSDRSIRAARSRLAAEIECGRYQLVQADLFDNPPLGSDFDLVVSFFVMEHIEDDTDFVRRLMSYVRPGGHVVIAVPGRKDRWTTQDDTVGHLRHYDHDDFRRIFRVTGLLEPAIWSTSFPITNVFYGLSNFTFRHSAENAKAALSAEEQTRQSGVREIPFHTMFPWFFRFFFNPTFLTPFFLFQRLFYGVELGFYVLARGRVDAEHRQR